MRVGCIRWQHDGLPIPGDSREILAEDAVCLLDVPVHKTGTAFTKPVDPIVGQAIGAWQALRPDQPKRLDRKTAERVDMLFSVRAQPVAKEYINHTIIPALCGKAGVPTADVRGNITSHRARSTIASQLYNAKEPMTLFELQAWLGHRTPEHHPALRQDHPEYVVQGLLRGRILRPQRPRHRGPRRPRRRPRRPPQPTRVRPDPGRTDTTPDRNPAHPNDAAITPVHQGK